ncbi:MAG: glycosyltransferase family 39 protein [Bacteroidales bacterium]|nr:glycosyltransferase family 39 protein [Bacteroidales bacterium]
MLEKSKVTKVLYALIAISVLIRAIIAATIELGNDEVYYWTYALYPDFSHFDHPPMIGFVIQLFSLDLLLDSEFFIRLGAVFFGTINTIIAYKIGNKLKDELSGLYAAFLYNTSIYSFIVAGTFILPDSPQLFFWLLSLYFAFEWVQKTDNNMENNKSLLLTGLFIGLGMLSKYTTVFIWLGLLLYILIYNRYWLRTYTLYLSLFISAILFTPVIWWNIQNDFISLTYQGGRVSLFESTLQPDYFLLEAMGEFFYNNPVNFIITAISVFIFIWKKRQFIKLSYFRILILTSIPLIVVFVFFSFFRRTLPHWTGPGYVTLIFIASAYLSGKTKSTNISKFMINEIRYAILFISIVIIFAFIQINFGIIKFDDPKTTNPTELGETDISLDVYGWKQIGEGFSAIMKRDLAENRISQESAIITYRWFPAANFDYYAARPNNYKVLALGKIEDIHKYYDINKYRGGFRLGMDAYYITTSRDFIPAEKVYGNFFEKIETPDTIKIYRRGNNVMNAFVFRMKKLKKLPNYYIQYSADHVKPEI